jgi:uncharacterized Zn-binding protein involved in type VI secretion
MGFVASTDLNIKCPHMGDISVTSRNLKVLINGNSVLSEGDLFIVSSCPRNECIKVVWINPSSKVRINGQKVILRESDSMCLNAGQSPQGPSRILAIQNHVTGS